MLNTCAMYWPPLAQLERMAARSASVHSHTSCSKCCVKSRRAESTASLRAPVESSGSRRPRMGQESFRSDSKARSRR
eukprot:1038688-Lingulodinium_polyedra.AAC.1